MIEFIREPVTLSCPCGLPLTLSFTSDGKWVLGHIDKACSPLIHFNAKLPNDCETHGESVDSDIEALGKVMLQFLRLKKDGKFNVECITGEKK